MQIEDKIPFEVLGHRVLIDPEIPKDTLDEGALKGFKIVGDGIQREKAATTIGVIVGIGKNAWKAFDDGQPWAKVGDRVYFAKYGGKWITAEDGKEYICCNDEDCQIKVLE